MFETTTIRHTLGHDFSHGVVPASNPAIVVPARTRAHAEQIAEWIDHGERITDNDGNETLRVYAPEDFLYVAVHPNVRARYDLPAYITPPTRERGWHPYQRISDVLWSRDLPVIRKTTLTVEDGVTIYWSARPEQNTRNAIESALASATAAA